jgi:hypothetical protein
MIHLADVASYKLGFSFEKTVQMKNENNYRLIKKYWCNKCNRLSNSVMSRGGADVCPASFVY